MADRAMEVPSEDDPRLDDDDYEEDNMDPPMWMTSP